jgi:hypothetical protein
LPRERWALLICLKTTLKDFLAGDEEEQNTWKRGRKRRDHRRCGKFTPEFLEERNTKWPKKGSRTWGLGK